MGGERGKVTGKHGYNDGAKSHLMMRSQVTTIHRSFREGWPSSIMDDECAMRNANVFFNAEKGAGTILQEQFCPDWEVKSNILAIGSNQQDER